MDEQLDVQQTDTLTSNVKPLYLTTYLVVQYKNNKKHQNFS